MIATNSAPSYVAREGGAHWTLEATCGTSASALRDGTDANWLVFEHDSLDATEMPRSSDWNDAKILTYLKGLIREAIVAALADLDETVFV